MELSKRVKHVIAEAIQVHHDEVTDSSAIYMVRNWDSLGQLAVITAIEDTFGISVPDDQIEALTTVHAILMLVHGRGVA